MSTKQRLAVGLDTGSSRTRCVVCLLEDGYMRFLGFGASPSAGWSRGRLADYHAYAESVRAALKEAEIVSGVQVDEVCAGIGGASIQGGNARGVYEYGRPRQIENDDLALAVERATRVRLEDDRMLLHVFPQDFTVDGRAGFRNPRGALCHSRLEANVHVITASTQEHQWLVAAIHEAHLAVEETVFEPVAAAYAAVLPEDRSRGVALVDIGTNSTDLAIYDADALLLAGSIPIGGDHFTRDVAWLLKVSYADAERLKQEYGCALLGLTADNSLIEIPSPEGRPLREARRKELNEILEARAEELFQYVRVELAKVGMEQALLEGIVLTGGGAMLNGMCDIAEKVLNCQARNGLAVGIEHWPDEINDPTWTTAAGLAMYSARVKLRQDFKRRAPGLVGMVLPRPRA